MDANKETETPDQNLVSVGLKLTNDNDVRVVFESDVPPELAGECCAILVAESMRGMVGSLKNNSELSEVGFNALFHSALERTHSYLLSSEHGRALVEYIKQSGEDCEPSTYLTADPAGRRIMGIQVTGKDQYEDDEKTGVQLDCEVEFSGGFDELPFSASMVVCQTIESVSECVMERAPTTKEGEEFSAVLEKHLAKQIYNRIVSSKAPLRVFHQVMSYFEAQTDPETLN